MKCISYSLFGYERLKADNCFDFNSYLRSLPICIRMNRLLFPDWEINLQTDKSTYEAWGEYLNQLPIIININDNGIPLTLAMLWRLKPIFEIDNNKWKYTHVLCRDLDSPATYREAQAVRYWIDKDKTMHAITDSISHDIPLLGGMIGIRPDHFTERVNVRSWEQLINKNSSYDWKIKGSDQAFLNTVIYPCVAQKGSDSITQHYCLGMANTFLSDYHNQIQDMDLGHLIQYKDSNDICGHIGASGYYNTVMSKFINKHKGKFTDLFEIEAKYPDIFSWVKNGCY